MTCVTCCALAAKTNAASHSGVIGSAKQALCSLGFEDGRSSMSPRICSANGVPPGSLVSTTRYPCSRRNFASRASWVVFPLPSIPSRVMKTPGRRLFVCVFRVGMIIDDQSASYSNLLKISRNGLRHKGKACIIFCCGYPRYVIQSLPQTLFSNRFVGDYPHLGHRPHSQDSFCDSR